MNELAERNNIQIAACVFCKLNSQTNELTMGEKPYFYLDLFNMSVGDYALVHNGTEFGVIRVARVLLATDPVAVQFVTKPLLARITYDVDSINEASKRLVVFKESTTDHRIQAAIDKALDNDPPVRKKSDREKIIDSIDDRFDYLD